MLAGCGSLAHSSRAAVSREELSVHRGGAIVKQRSTATLGWIGLSGADGGPSQPLHKYAPLTRSGPLAPAFEDAVGAFTGGRGPGLDVRARALLLFRGSSHLAVLFLAGAGATARATSERGETGARCGRATEMTDCGFVRLLLASRGAVTLATGSDGCSTTGTGGTDRPCADPGVTPLERLLRGGRRLVRAVVIRPVNHCAVGRDARPDTRAAAKSGQCACGAPCRACSFAEPADRCQGARPRRGSEPG